MIIKVKTLVFCGNFMSTRRSRNVYEKKYAYVRFGHLYATREQQLDRWSGGKMEETNSRFVNRYGQCCYLRKKTHRYTHLT